MEEAMNSISPIQIGLIVLIIAGIWALVELALTLKTSRKKIDDVSKGVEDTLDEIKPIISKLDGVVDELEPAAKELPVLMGKASNAADALTVDLLQVDNILTDVSSVTGAASGVTSSVTKATGAAVSAASNFIGKAAKTVEDKLGLGGSQEPEVAALEESQQEPNDVVEVSSEGAGYFTYPSQDEQDAKSDDGK